MFNSINASALCMGDDCTLHTPVNNRCKTKIIDEWATYLGNLKMKSIKNRIS